MKTIAKKKEVVAQVIKKPIEHTVKVRSRHPTHDGIRGHKLSTYPFRVVVRLGSTTPVEDVYPVAVQKGLKIVEINAPDAVIISANKLKMKRAFDDAGIKTAAWFKVDHAPEVNDAVINLEWKYPIVAKHIFGSRGTGNTLLASKEEVDKFVSKIKDFSKYIFEKYYDYNREYRLHVNKDGCFYTCRKMLKEDTPKEKRWFRNDSNSVWVKEDNELFDKPTTWDLIVADCVRALDTIGLDFAAFDVRVQSSKKKTKKDGEVVRENPEWIIIESNSAPSFGEVTTEKYLEMLPKLIKDKANVSQA